MPASHHRRPCSTFSTTFPITFPQGSGRPLVCHHTPSLQMSPSARVLGSGQAQQACWLIRVFSSFRPTPMPGLRNENYQTRNVMGAVTGLPGVRQRGEGISAATRLASDQAVIRVCVVSSVDPSDLVIMHDIRDDMFRSGGPTSARLLGTLLARARSCRDSQGQAALCHDFTYSKGSEAGNVSFVTLKATELCHNLASIRPPSSSAAGR